MRYDEYTVEQLSKLPTKRLLSLQKSARRCYPSVASMWNECCCIENCNCTEQDQIAVDKHEKAMARIKSILDTREHVQRKGK